MRVRLKTDEPAPPLLWFAFAAVFLLGGVFEIVTRNHTVSGVLYCCIALSYVLDVFRPRVAQWFFGLSLAALLALGVSQLVRARVGIGAFNTVLAVLFLVLLIQRIRRERAAVAQNTMAQ